VIVNTSNVNFVNTPTFTLPAGTNRYVLFMLAYNDFPNIVTIAGTVATMIVQIGADEAAAMWGANIPDSTAAGNYTITFDRTCSVRKFIAVFTGVSRDPVVDSAACRNSSSSSDGDTLTVDCVGGGWVHDIVFTAAAKTAGANQTVIYNSTSSGIGVSYKSGLAHGTTSMAWTWTGARSAHTVVSLRPAKASRGIIMF
jgi:hypothetical protein